MANIKTWLLEAEKTDGPIEAIVVGKHDDDRWDDDDRRPEHQRDVLLSREDGLALLDADYDNGYGGADCFPFYAWNANFVYSIHEYDGSTSLQRVPRHPVACSPEI